MKLGLIGDTHGVILPAVPRLFTGVDRIIHAGDLDTVEVLQGLEAIAPVTAVQGNYDTDPQLVPRLLPDPSALVLDGVQALITHRLITMDWNLNRGLIAAMVKRMAPGAGLFIFGHTHFPVLECIDGICFVNPGYAGPDRLEGPATAARLEIDSGRISGEIVHLEK